MFPTFLEDFAEFLPEQDDSTDPNFASLRKKQSPQSKIEKLYNWL